MARNSLRDMKVLSMIAYPQTGPWADSCSSREVFWIQLPRERGKMEVDPCRHSESGLGFGQIHSGCRRCRRLEVQHKGHGEGS